MPYPGSQLTTLDTHPGQRTRADPTLMPGIRRDLLATATE